MTDLRTDNLFNFTTDIKNRATAKGATNPGIINPKDLDEVIRSIPSDGLTLSERGKTCNI